MKISFFSKKKRVINSPENSIILEIKAAELIVSE